MTGVAASTSRPRASAERVAGRRAPRARSPAAAPGAALNPARAGGLEPEREDVDHEQHAHDGGERAVLRRPEQPGGQDDEAVGRQVHDAHRDGDDGAVAHHLTNRRAETHPSSLGRTRPDRRTRTRASRTWDVGYVTRPAGPENRTSSARTVVDTRRGEDMPFGRFPAPVAFGYPKVAYSPPGSCPWEGAGTPTSSPGSASSSVEGARSHAQQHCWPGSSWLWQPSWSCSSAAALDLELESVALLGAALGAVVALVPGPDAAGPPRRLRRRLRGRLGRVRRPRRAAARHRRRARRRGRPGRPALRRHHRREPGPAAAVDHAARHGGLRGRLRVHLRRRAAGARCPPRSAPRPPCCSTSRSASWPRRWSPDLAPGDRHRAARRPTTAPRPPRRDPTTSADDGRPELDDFMMEKTK